MIKKLAASLVLVAFVTLASMGISYATEEYAEFTFMDSWDNEGVVNDIGDVSAFIDTAGALNISVTNAYPGYMGYVWFQITHIGGEDDPRIYLTSINPTNPSEIDIAITELNENPIPINTYLDPGDALDGMVNISILQEANQGQSYGFNVVITFEDAPV